MQEVDVLCIAQLSVDEENTAVMRWFYNIAKKYGRVVYEDITRMKINCDDTVDRWLMNGV